MVKDLPHVIALQTETNSKKDFLILSYSTLLFLHFLIFSFLYFHLVSSILFIYFMVKYLTAKQLYIYIIMFLFNILLSLDSYKGCFTSHLPPHFQQNFHQKYISYFYIYGILYIYCIYGVFQMLIYLVFLSKECNFKTSNKKTQLYSRVSSVSLSILFPHSYITNFRNSVQKHQREEKEEQYRKLQSFLRTTQMQQTRSP